MSKINIQVKIVGELQKLKEQNPEEALKMYPSYESLHNAGLDLRAAINEPLTLQPNETKLVGTGWAIYLKDPNYVGLITPRSGLGSKGLVIGNLTGVIDANYQNELKMCLWNRSNEPKTIQPWDRVAQYLIVPVSHGVFEVVEEFTEESDRGLKGFGSSGVK